MPARHEEDRHLIASLDAQAVDGDVGAQLGIAAEHQSQAEKRTGVPVGVGRRWQNGAQVEARLVGAVHDLLARCPLARELHRGYRIAVGLCHALSEPVRRRVEKDADTLAAVDSREFAVRVHGMVGLDQLAWVVGQSLQRRPEIGDRRAVLLGHGITSPARSRNSSVTGWRGRRLARWPRMTSWTKCVGACGDGHVAFRWAGTPRGSIPAPRHHGDCWPARRSSMVSSPDAQCAGGTSRRITRTAVGGASTARTTAS